ncbi:MAG: hypothetical protein R3F60_07695 [bacterium]
MNATWKILGVLLLTAGVAHAKPSFTVQGQLGFNGTADADNSESEKLESDFGLMGTVEFPLSRQLRLGGRLAYEAADGADSKSAYSSVDAGVWARFVFVPGKFEFFGAGALGLSYITLDPDNSTTDLTGQGFHFLMGAGASYPVSRTARVIGGMYYSHHSGEPEGEVAGQTVKVDNGVLSRILLTAGIMF